MKKPKQSFFGAFPGLGKFGREEIDRFKDSDELEVSENSKKRLRGAAKKTPEFVREEIDSFVDE